MARTIVQELELTLKDALRKARKSTEATEFASFAGAAQDLTYSLLQATQLPAGEATEEDVA